MTSIYETSAGLTTLPMSVVRTFDFTDQESVLCLGLVQGKSLDDMADECHQPRNKLRIQLNTLLSKTGTDTEAKLVTVILSNPDLWE